MIFQLRDLEFADSEELIEEGMEYANSVSDDKADLKVNTARCQIFTELVKENKLGTGIANARVHFMKPEADHSIGHVHGVATGVYYLQVTKDTGDLVVEGKTIKPEPKMLVVVPAFQNHGITKNRSKITRLALAFDIVE